MSYFDLGVKGMKNVCVMMMASLILLVPVFLSAQSEPNGADIYKARCGSCHGDQGQGVPGAKLPAVKGTKMTIEQLVTWITTGTGGKMVHTTPIVNIDKEQALAVAKHVKTLK
jgi:mono/diheme cytochrome c family protein